MLMKLIPCCFSQPMIVVLGGLAYKGQACLGVPACHCVARDQGMCHVPAVIDQLFGSLLTNQVRDESKID